MNWDDLRYLLAVQREGTLAAAARALRVDQTTVGRRITALEKELGARIFVKKAGRLELTSAGHRACGAAAQMEAASRALTADVGGVDTRVEGLVRLSAPEGFVRILSSALQELRERQPALTFELLTSTTSANLLKGEADLAIRMHHQSQPSLVARKLGDLHWGVFASEGYLRRRGAPKDLVGHDVVGFDDSLAKTPGGLYLAAKATGANVVLRTNNVMTALAGIAAGLGIGSVPDFIAADANGIRRAIPGSVGTSSVLVIAAKDQLKVPRIRATVDHLAAYVKRELAGLKSRLD